MHHSSAVVLSWRLLNIEADWANIEIYAFTHPNNSLLIWQIAERILLTTFGRIPMPSIIAENPLFWLGRISNSIKGQSTMIVPHILDPYGVGAYAI